MSNKDWYARRLNTRPAPTNEPAPVFTPAVTDGYSHPVQLTPDVSSEVEAVEEYAPAGASHLRHKGNCPECNSTNYASYQWGGQTNHRCYDCGYPVIQSGTNEGSMKGVPGTKEYAALQADRAGTWGGGNFKDGAGIIGRDPAVKTDVPR